MSFPDKDDRRLSAVDIDWQMIGICAFYDFDKIRVIKIIAVSAGTKFSDS